MCVLLYPTVYWIGPKHTYTYSWIGPKHTSTCSCSGRFYWREWRAEPDCSTIVLDTNPCCIDYCPQIEVSIWTDFMFTRCFTKEIFVAFVYVFIQQLFGRSSGKIIAFASNIFHSTSFNVLYLQWLPYLTEY